MKSLVLSLMLIPAAGAYAVSVRHSVSAPARIDSLTYVIDQTGSEFSCYPRVDTTYESITMMALANDFIVFGFGYYVEILEALDMPEEMENACSNI